MSFSVCLRTAPPVTVSIIDTRSGTAVSLYWLRASLNAWWRPTVPGGEKACEGAGAAELLATLVGIVVSPVVYAEAQ